MKYIAKNIAVGFKNNRFLIILILVIQIVSFWIFLFSFGMLNSYIDPKGASYDHFREFQIDFLKEERITVGELRSRLGEFEEKMGEDFYTVSIMCISEYRTENGGIIPLCSHIVTKEAYNHYAELGVFSGDSYASLMERADSNCFV